MMPFKPIFILGLFMRKKQKSNTRKGFSEREHVALEVLKVMVNKFPALDPSQTKPIDIHMQQNALVLGAFAYADKFMRIRKLEQ